jgi:hypothetical protein
MLETSAFANTRTWHRYLPCPVYLLFEMHSVAATLSSTPSAVPQARSSPFCKRESVWKSSSPMSAERASSITRFRSMQPATDIGSRGHTGCLSSTLPSRPRFPPGSAPPVQANRYRKAGPAGSNRGHDLFSSHQKIPITRPIPVSQALKKKSFQPRPQHPFIIAKPQSRSYFSKEDSPFSSPFGSSRQ